MRSPCFFLGLKLDSRVRKFRTTDSDSGTKNPDSDSDSRPKIRLRTLRLIVWYDCVLKNDLRKIFNSSNKRCTIMYKQSFSYIINCTKVKQAATELHKSPNKTDRVRSRSLYKCYTYLLIYLLTECTNRNADRELSGSLSARWSSWSGRCRVFTRPSSLNVTSHSE